MSQLTFTILIGGSMVVTTLVWLYLLVITVRQLRTGLTADREAA